MGVKTQYSPTFPMFPGGAYSVTASDTANLPYVSVIYIGGAGSVKVTTAQGDTVTFVGLQTGSVLPVQALQVWSTGTTATNLIGIY